ncbi:MAG: tetratricopeptide repeat protein [Acidobacteriota bacterium]
MLFCVVAPAVAQTDIKVAATWQVQKYDIAVTLPTSDTDRMVAVRAKLSLKNVSGSPASTLTLRISPTAEILSVKLNDAAIDFTKGEEKAGAATLQKIALRVPSMPSAGTFSVVVDYKLNVKENSGLASVSTGSAQFLPLSFWYPTPNSWFFARGADYAPVHLSVNAPGITVISSGVSSASGNFDQNFDSQPFFAAGNWEMTNAAGIVVALPKGSGALEQKRATDLASLVSEARTFLSSILGAAPDEPVRIIAARRGAGFASGGTVFVDSSVFRRSKIDSQTAMSIADGMAKLWLGGSVNITGDGNGAIREGLAKYLATQFIENKYGKDVADVERTRQRSAYAGVVSRDAPITVVSPLDDYYYSVVANKGAMVWRLLAKRAGEAAFFSALRSSTDDGTVSLAEIRGAFPTQREFLDYGFDQVTDTNLQAGLPLLAGGEWKAALRNTGSIDATVIVTATLASGERMTAQSTVRAKSFGEVSFKTPAKVDRLEIDSENLYPQTDYSDDAAPRELTEGDPHLAVKRLFDKQEFAKAVTAASSVLRDLPRFDDVRVLLGRSLIALGKPADAERELRAVLDEKLPSARSIAWANVGLADISSTAGKNADALKSAGDAISADAEYGASLAARAIRNKLTATSRPDEQVNAFFTQFDRSATANKKAELQALILSGEVSKFAAGIAGQTEQWKTKVISVDNLDAETALVETQLAIKLLNRDVSTGTAVFRLTRTPSGLKLSGVDIFEVR